MEMSAAGSGALWTQNFAQNFTGQRVGCLLVAYLPFQN